MFFTEHLVNLIVTETNKFFWIHLPESASTWILVSDKMKGHQCRPNVFFLRIVSDAMSQKIETARIVDNRYIIAHDWFLLLLRRLHFSDNNLPVEGDSLAHIRVIVDSMRERYSNAVKPNRQVCIDESLLLFKGRLFILQLEGTKTSLLAFFLLLLYRVS